MGYLDKVGEIEIASRYQQLAGGRNVSSLNAQSARNILEQNLTQPIAWKLVIDLFLSNDSGDDLLKLLDTVKLKKGTPQNYQDFSLCYSYAVNVVASKARYSTHLFGKRDWSEICSDYKNINANQGISLHIKTNRLDIRRAMMSLTAELGEPAWRAFAIESKEKFPEDYGIQYYYALSLKNMSYEVGPDGKSKTILKQDLPAYERQLELLRRKWPKQTAPFYNSMKFYEKQDIAKAKEFARQYLAIEKKPFRINWKNDAKEILSK